MNTTAYIANYEKSAKKQTNSRAKKAIMLSCFACFFMLVLQLVTAFAIIPFKEYLKDEIFYSYINIAIYCICIIIPFAILSVIFKFSFKQTDTELVKHSFPKKPLLYIFGTLGIGYLVNLTISILFPEFLEYYAVESDFSPSTPYGIFLTYISTALLPAVLEEWAIRGIICKNLLPYGKKGAIIISSLLFGILHIDPPRIIYTTIIGILLAICYEYTGSLLLPMIIHFLNNALSVTITVFATPENENAITAGALIASLVIYVFIGLGIAAIVYYKKHGIAHKKISINQSPNMGYKLSATEYITNMFTNVGFILFALIYVLFYFLYFVW